MSFHSQTQAHSPADYARRPLFEPIARLLSASGDYTVTVSSHGELGPDAQPFELLASLPITLVP